MPRSGLSSGVSDSGGLKALMAGIGSGRQFVSVKDQMKLMSHQAELQDQLNANAQTYTNQGKTREAELGDIRATRDTARMTFGREHQADLFTRFRGANPEVTDYDMDAKGGFRTKMGAMAFPSGDVKPFGGGDKPKKPSGPRNTVKKIQARVDSGELSPAEAANTYSNYAAHVGRDKADDWAGKTPAPVRGGVEYVAGVGSSRQFTTDSAGTTTAPTASSTPKRTRTRKAGASSGTASQTKPTSTTPTTTTGTTTPIK